MAIGWLIVWLVPPVGAYLVQWLPILNGPHLFLGIPSIMWWTCIIGLAANVIAVAVVEAVVRSRRPDRIAESIELSSY
jgi:hypothetical protein